MSKMTDDRRQKTGEKTVNQWVSESVTLFGDRRCILALFAWCLSSGSVFQNENLKERFMETLYTHDSDKLQVILILSSFQDQPTDLLNYRITDLPFHLSALSIVSTVAILKVLRTTLGPRP